MIKKKQKLPKGSVLVFAIVILAMLLAIGLSIAQMAARERRAASSLGNSNKAFQAADSGAEVAARKIKNATDDQTLINIINNCTENNAKPKGSVGDAQYFVTFLDSSGEEITNCNTPVSDIFSVKSVGSYAGTVRAIQTNVIRQSP